MPTKKLLIEIPEKMHTDLKKKAADEGMSMRQIVLRSLKKELKMQKDVVELIGDLRKELRKIKM